MKGLREGFILFFIFVTSVIGGIFGSEIVGPYFIKRPIFLKYSLEPTPVYQIEKKELKIDEGSALKTKQLINEKEKEIFDRISKSIFVLRTKGIKGEIQMPALVVSSGSESLILTFPEISFKEGQTFLQIEGKTIYPRLVKKDNELLLLKFSDKGMETVDFFESEKLKTGERIFFISKIFGGGGEKIILDEGLVSDFDEKKIETSLKELREGFVFSQEGKLLGALKVEDKKTSIISISVIENFLKSR